MTESHHSSSTVLWNTVLPGLGVALVLGTPLLLALVIAAVASVLITVVASPVRARLRTA